MEHILSSQYESDPINIMGHKIDCAVLEDGTSVISRREFNRTLGITEGGGAQGLPRFLSAKALESFIGEELRVRIENPIQYKMLSGNVAYGLPAEMITDVLNVWVKASDAGKLNPSQEKIAQQARILLTASSKVGWVSLVHSASGFDKVRDKKHLEQLLNLYIAKEFQPYIKTFQDVFYEEIYKLKNWKYDKTKNKYSVVGKYTLTYVYGLFPENIIEEIKKKTPRDKSGNYTKKLFQSLTSEYGKPYLDRALGGIIALLKASDTWGDFKKLYNKAYGPSQRQLELPGDWDTIDIKD